MFLVQLRNLIFFGTKFGKSCDLEKGWVPSALGLFGFLRFSLNPTSKYDPAREGCGRGLAHDEKWGAVTGHRSESSPEL